MITLLRIRNLAVIESLELELFDGLNVITGETGAGKSMLVTALELLRGGRAGAHLVRTGAKSAVIEAMLEANGEQTVIKRVISANGRSRGYIDGELATVHELKDHGAQWLDISSQHEHHTLVDPTHHLRWLDGFAGVEPVTEKLAQLVQAARTAAAAVDSFRQRARDAHDRVDLLRFQAQEITRIDPRPGELDELLATLDRLEHASAILGHTSAAVRRLHHGDRSAVDHIVTALSELRSAERHDTALTPLIERLESVRIELEDLADELDRTQSRYELDPDELEQVRTRERELSRLVRRHGSIDAALERLAELEDELAVLEDADANLARLQAAAEAALAQAAAQARELSQIRRAHAERLGAAVTDELSSLGMGSARIEVNVDAIPAGSEGIEVDGARLGPNGLDRVEFLIAPNPGETPRPLARIASGGELSRALLALKGVLRGIGSVSTYVFDEVDTGVGGAVAEGIGRKLHEVAREHQVLCITHQAVIAAWGDHHHRVEKRVEDGRTRTSIVTLSPLDREEELARMLGGADITEGVRNAARDLLRGARP